MRNTKFTLQSNLTMVSRLLTCAINNQPEIKLIEVIAHTTACHSVDFAMSLYAVYVSIKSARSDIAKDIIIECNQILMPYNVFLSLTHDKSIGDHIVITDLEGNYSIAFC